MATAYAITSADGVRRALPPELTLTFTTGSTVSAAPFNATSTFNRFGGILDHEPILVSSSTTQQEVPYFRAFTDELAACSAMTRRLPNPYGGGWWPNLIELGYRLFVLSFEDAGDVVATGTNPWLAWPWTSLPLRHAAVVSERGTASIYAIANPGLNLFGTVQRVNFTGAHNSLGSAY